MTKYHNQTQRISESNIAIKAKNHDTYIHPETKVDKNNANKKTDHKKGEKMKKYMSLMSSAK